ncbi:hypothetical protein [Streptomyces chartreusis]
MSTNYLVSAPSPPVRSLPVHDGVARQMGAELPTHRIKQRPSYFDGVF